ncbi:MAG: glycine cleavage T C-terminal barrel domain-containing protein, partial [Polaribacter sp.]|nr:glycine cleavage T C-terminal barrel domain-containing protein [Polaribacter sp.]
IEAGLSWITKFTKEFVNAEALAKEKEHKPKRRLIAFELNERGVPRQGYNIVDESGKVIGNVTSGTMSPCLQKGIGMGYVPQIFSKSGSKIYIQVRKKAISATIVKLPFYKG